MFITREIQKMKNRKLKNKRGKNIMKEVDCTFNNNLNLFQSDFDKARQSSQRMVQSPVCTPLHNSAKRYSQGSLVSDSKAQHTKNAHSQRASFDYIQSNTYPQLSPSRLKPRKRTKLSTKIISPPAQRNSIRSPTTNLSPPVSLSLSKLSLPMGNRKPEDYWHDLVNQRKLSPHSLNTISRCKLKKRDSYSKPINPWEYRPDETFKGKPKTLDITTVQQENAHKLSSFINGGYILDSTEVDGQYISLEKFSEGKTESCLIKELYRSILKDDNFITLDKDEIKGATFKALVYTSELSGKIPANQLEKLMKTNMIVY